MRKAGDIITAFFKERFGPEFMDTARSTAGLFSSWKEIVMEIWPRTYGSEQSKDDIPAAAVHSRIYEMERGILLVEADHPGWIMVLQTKQADLLSAVQKKYPELDVRGIAFRLSKGSFSASKSDAGEKSAAIAPNPGAEVAVQDSSFVSVSESRHSGKPRDEEFYNALKKLEESMKRRNSL